MEKNFARLKRKTRIVSVLLSLLLGLGVGAAVFAGMMLARKLSAEPLPFLHDIYAVCAAVLTVPLFLFILIPSDKRFAGRLDREHRLQEKVRTMVEFRKSEDAFAVIQREDADEKLGKIPFSPWRKKQLLCVLLVLVIAASFLMTAFVLPERESEGPVEPPLGEFDKQWILAELSAIRSTVEKSLIADPLKEKTLGEIASLSAFVEAHEYLSEMKIEAIKTVLRTDEALDDENTALLIGEKLSLCTNETLKTLGAELLKLNGTGVQKKLAELNEVLQDTDPTELYFVADELSAAVEGSGADTASPLFALLKNLAAALHGCSSSDASEVDAAFGTVKTEAMNQVMIQNINKRVIETVISRLCSLFGITAADLIQAGADEDISVTPPSAELPDEEGGDEDEDYENEEIGSGGIGTGDRVYGSNDMIYNPYTNEYVPYGQLFDEYNNRVLQMIEDGRIPPDFEEFTKEYFRSLSEYHPEA